MIFHLLVVQLKSMDQIWLQISWPFLKLNPTHTFRYEGAMELKATVKCNFNQKHQTLKATKPLHFPKYL